MAEFDGSDNSKESIDDEVTLMSKVFKQMMKKKGKFQHSSRRKVTRFKKKYKIQNNEIICFECKKLKHMKAKCLQLKKRRYFDDNKKKSLMVTWDNPDNEKSSSSNDEQANVYLMANTDKKVEVKTCSNSNSSSNDSSYNEEDITYDVLLQKCHMISLQCKNIKKFLNHLFLKTLN